MNEAKTILVVDDDPLVRQLLQKIIESMGHHVITTERAQRARRILDQSTIDVMFLDLEMPDINGDLLLRASKKHNAPLPPTIVVSGHLDRTRVDPLLDLGVESIIAKPFHVTRVVNELTRVLQVHTESASG